MPADAQVLCVQIQKTSQHEERICVWAKVDLDKPNVERIFRIIGTGHEFYDSKYNYIGTVQASGGFVWHIFEQIK